MTTVPGANEWKTLQERIDRLELRLRRQRLAGLIAAGVAVIFILSSFLPGNPVYITARGLRIVDATGKPRILIGAPNETAGRKRKDAGTASMVVLGPEGQDRVVIGEAPDPVVQGNTFKRIAPAYGLTIHDSNGQERGGIAFLDNGRAVVALDRKGQDAVAMIVNDQTGFAGLTVNYEQPTGIYKEGLRLGTKNDEVWLDLADTAEQVRAGLHVRDAGAPVLELKPAGSE